MVEDHPLASHTTGDIAACKQFTTLEDDAVATGIEDIHPKFLIQNLSCKDEHLDRRITLLGVATDFYAHRSGTSQAQIEQHQVGKLLLDQPEVCLLTVGSADDFGLWYLVADNTLSPFQFKRHILYNNDFKIVHIRICILIG